MRYVPKMLPHLCICLSAVVITLLVIDKFNTQMNFIDNNITKNMMLVLLVIAVVCSVMLIAHQRRGDRNANRHH